MSGNVNPSAPTRTQTQTLISRLQNSETARQIYFLQSVPFSYQFASARPDGVYGPITRGIVNQMRAIMGLPAESSFSPSDLTMAIQAMTRRFGPPSSMRLKLVPDALPGSLISAINASAARAGASGMALQAVPSG